MALNASSLAQSVIKSGRGISSLNPQELGLLATDPDVAKNFGELGKQAERFIQTAPAYWWANYPGQHPSVTGKPVTGAGLYTPTMALAEQDKMNRLFDQKQALQATTASTISPIQQVAQQISVPSTQVTPTLPVPRIAGTKFNFSHPKLRGFYNLLQTVKTKKDPGWDKYGLDTASRIWEEFKQAGLLPSGATFSDHVLGQGVPAQTFTAWAMDRPEYHTAPAPIVPEAQPRAIAEIQQAAAPAAPAAPIAESRDVTQRASRGTPRDKKFSPRASGAIETRVAEAAKLPPESLADRQAAIAGREATVERIKAAIVPGETERGRVRIPSGTQPSPQDLTVDQELANLKNVIATEEAMQVGAPPVGTGTDINIVTTDYSSYGPAFLQTLADQGDMQALDELATRLPGTQSILDQFGRTTEPTSSTPVLPVAQTGLGSRPPIQTEGFYQPPVEGITAIPEVSAIPAIDYTTQTNDYLEGLVLSGDQQAQSELENRAFHQTGVEDTVMAPTPDSRTATGRAMRYVGTDLGDDIYNEGGWVIGSLRERDRGMPEVVNAQGKVAGYYDSETNTLYDKKGKTLRSNVVRKPPISDFTTLTLDQLQSQQSSPAKEKEWQRRQDFEILGFDLDDMELMGQLKDITLTEEQRNKMYDDWHYLRDSSADITTNLTASYRQQFIDWIRGKGSAPTTKFIPDQIPYQADIEPVTEVVAQPAEPTDFTSLTLDELDRLPETDSRFNELERRTMLDILGYDTSNMELMGQLKGMTFTGEQMNKLGDDARAIMKDYNQRLLPQAYTVQFQDWMGGRGPAPHLAQIMGASATETIPDQIPDQAAIEPVTEVVPETEWVPPAPYVPTEPTEAVTIDPASPVTYNEVPIPAGGTSPDISPTELAPYDPVALPQLSPVSASIPGQRQVQAATGAEEMANLTKARRDYFEQFEAPAIRAQAEQERSALGQLRGQMMARQGLMGSPLGVGLGVQQEAQMRGLALQEVGRQRGAMEMQLAEQRYRADQAAADRALQAQQFGVTAGLQQAGIRLQQQELAGQQALQRAGLDIRQQEFATTTALAKSEQELRKEESDASLELERLNQEIRQREFGTTTGLEMSDQELRRQQVNATLNLEQAQMAVQQKQFASTTGLQISQQQLEKMRIDATERLNQATLALEREEFGVEKGFQKTEQDLRREQFEATRDLGVANQQLREEQYGTDVEFRQAEQDLQREQLEISTKLEQTQQRLDQERFKATQVLEEADLALRTEQFGAATEFQVTQQDLEERRFQAQEQLNRIDQDFRQSQLDASLEMDQADQRFRDKQLGVTTGLQRAQLAIEERQLGLETEEQRLDREFRERQLESSIGLEEAQLGLSTRQLDENVAMQQIEQNFRDRQLAQQMGLAVTEQELAQDQFEANVLLEEADLQFKKHQADANRHLAIMELDLQQKRVNDARKSEESDRALRSAIQNFNESQARVGNATTQAELAIRREDLALSRQQLQQAYSNQLAAQQLGRDTLDQQGNLANTKLRTEAAIATGTAIGWVVGPDRIKKTVSEVGKLIGIGGGAPPLNPLAANIDPDLLQAAGERLQQLETDITNLDQPLQVSQGRRKTQPDNTMAAAPPITSGVEGDTPQPAGSEAGYQAYLDSIEELNATPTESPDMTARNAMIDMFGQTQQQTNPALNALKSRLGV